ncbi:MAG: peptide deformylase [Pseudomonadota bacterium]|jgi:peptide deformylase
MAILELKIIPDPILRVTTSNVETFDMKLHTFLDNMFETMVSSNGIGLAAPQVGSSQRIAIMDLSVEGLTPPKVTSLSNKDPKTHIHQQRLEMINAKLISSGPAVSSDEGCLSIPDYRDSIKRCGTVTITSHDRYGNLFQVEADDLVAFCIQHEMDHLDGILFVDHLSRLKKQLFRRWCIKNGYGFEERASS